MKRFVCLLLALVVTSEVFAFNAKKATVEKMSSQVSKKLEHKLENYEQTIVNTTYQYYFKQCDEKWNEETWNTAVNKCVELCNSQAVIAAAKAGKFGEKFLKAIVVAGEDAWSGLNDWIEKKNDEYDKKHK